jgi:arylsulfatase A-like enzyme
LADCNNPYWQGKYTPSVNTGVNGLGLGSGYREDSLTCQLTLQILKEHHPNLVLINFRDPDYSAHSAIWSGYLAGIKKTDEYIFRLWTFLQNDSEYKKTTTLFITSDHGRHLDSVADGFVSHGDGCDGCRHLGFFASGPDFKNGVRINTHREQIDIPMTVAELMGFDLPNAKGNVMTELFGRR